MSSNRALDKSFGTFFFRSRRIVMRGNHIHRGLCPRTQKKNSHTMIIHNEEMFFEWRRLGISVAEE